MNHEELFTQYQQEPMSSESASQLRNLQAIVLEEKNEDLYRKTTLLLAETLSFLQQFDQAVEVLEKSLSSGLLQELSCILAISDKLVALLLKTEDFPALEATLSYRERFISENPKQQLMQSFYRAVCYEGLKRYPEAVDVLRRIGDNISNTNLVSKYLKLSMLEIRMKHFDEAKDAYERALFFDKTRKNEMFSLVESDLAFFENDYLTAQKKFQEFFIKSKDKNRYLDRYISICIALGNYEEAWKFFWEYVPKVDSMISKNYRYQFYQAGCQLAETLNKMDQAAEIKEKMLAVHSENPVIIDSFDGVNALLKASEKKVVFSKSRDLILDTFRNLALVCELPGLYFLQPGYGEVTVYRYQKGLLMESKVAVKSLNSTLTDAILNQNSDSLLFTEEELTKYKNSTTDPIFLPAEIISVQSYRVVIDSTKNAFMVGLLENNNQYDFVSKLLITTKSILDLKLSYFLRLNQTSREANAFERLFTTEDRGLGRIVDGVVFLMNSKSREIFEINEEMIPYEDFQKQFQTENVLYLDRLISKTSWTIPILTGKMHQKTVEIRVLVDDLITYLAIKDVTESSEKTTALRTRGVKTARYDLWNMHQFMEDYNNLKSQASLLLVSAQNQSVLQKRYLHTKVEEFTRLWHYALQKSVKSHAIGCYLEENGSVIVILSTIDKRVIDRMFREFKELSAIAFQSVLPLYDYPDLRGAVINILKNKTIDVNLDHLYHALTKTSKEDYLTYYDKMMLQQETQDEAVLFQLKTLMETGNFLLDYHQVGNLETRKVEMYRTWLANDSLPFGPEAVRPVAVSARLISGLDLMIFRRMIKEAVLFFDQSEIDVVFATTVGDETLQEPSLVNDLVQICRRNKLPLSKICLVYLPSAKELDPLSINSLRFLKEKGFLVGVEELLPQVRLRDKDILRDIDYCFINLKDFLSTPKSILDTLMESGNLKCVVSNVDTDESARMAVPKGGSRVEGKVLLSNLKMEQLIEKVSKKK